MSLNPQFRLISPSGDQVGVAGNSGETTEFVMQNAPEAGTYRVIVSDWAGNSAGEYVLRLALAPQDFIIPSGDEGGPMTNGASLQGEISLGDIDQWTFSADAGDFAHITLVTSNNLNPQFRLISPSGDQVGVAGNSGETTEFVMQNAPEAGTYRVIVSDWAGNSAGEYVLRLAQAPQDFIIPPGDEGGPMTNGASHQGEISLGDIDQWTFCGCG